MNKINFKNNLFNIHIFLLILLNNSFLSQIIIISFFILICFYFGTLDFNIFKLFFFFILSITLTINFEIIEVKNLLRLFQIILAFTFFPLKIKRDIININILKIVTFLIFIFTILDIFNSDIFFYIRDNFYPISENPWERAFDRNSDYQINHRYGSIFYNPNLLGQTIVILNIFYLIYFVNKKINKNDLFFIILNILCIIISGGRTAFIVLCLTSLPFFFKIKNFKNYLIFSSFFLLPIVIYYFSDSRLFNIVNSASMSDKWGILFNFIGKLDINTILNIFFGWFKTDIQFDNDIGNIFYFLGLFGLFCLFCFYFYQMFSINRRYIYLYSFIMISYGATLIINFKFLILTIYIFSLINSLKKEITKI